MTLDTEAVYRLLEHLSKNEALTANVKHSVRNGLIVGIFTVIFSIFLGPFGVAMGAAVGTVIVYAKGRNNYIPLVQVVKQLKEQERTCLVKEVNLIVSSLSYDDVIALQAIVASGGTLTGLSTVGKAALVNGIRTFFKDSTQFSLQGS